jgi:hypothetical protein
LAFFSHDFSAAAHRLRKSGFFCQDQADFIDTTQAYSHSRLREFSVSGSVSVSSSVSVAGTSPQVRGVMSVFVDVL